MKPENSKKLNKIDQGIIMAVKDNPELSNYQIGKKLHELGVVGHPLSVYHRLTKNDLMKKELAEIRRAHREQLSRELVPLAIKQTKAALKSKELNDKDKFSYTKLVLDKEFGEDHHHNIAVDKVQIGQLAIYQGLIQQNLGNKED